MKDRCYTSREGGRKCVETNNGHTFGGSVRLLSSKWETWNSQDRESTDT